MASFGETLRRERELREISLRQISEATKINIRYLEALEENRFDALPGGLFNKGFIRAYATFIGVDGEAMVDSYLHDVAARRQGPEAVSSRGPSNVHRPAGVPQRRAGPSIAAAASEGAAAPAIALAVPPRRAAEDRPPAARAETEASRPAAATPARWEHAAADREADQAHRHAVTGIEVADSQAPASSRVLVWVLSLVAGAGVLFLIVSLLRGTMPSAQRPAERAPVTDETAPAPPLDGGAVSPSGGDEVAVDQTSGVPPEVASQSPLTIGALAAPPATAAPSIPPARTAAKPAAARPGPLPPPAAGPAEEPASGGERPGHAREARGPMKVEIEALQETYVVLACDGGEVLNRIMDAGETEHAKCDSVIRVSATDAGAVHVSVNGFACLPLGDPGTRAFGYTIRLDDYARICPSTERGADARP